MMLIQSEFNIGQEVYLKTDTDQKRRIVTGVLIRPTGINYELVCGDRSSWHYELEISAEKDVLAATTN